MMKLQTVLYKRLIMNRIKAFASILIVVCVSFASYMTYAQTPQSQEDCIGEHLFYQNNECVCEVGYEKRADGQCYEEEDFFQTVDVGRKHEGRVVTWGPVTRDGNYGNVLGLQQGVRHWAEYEFQTNRPLRIIPITDQRPISGSAYNALVQKWLDVKSAETQLNGSVPQQIGKEQYLQLPCLNESGARSTPNLGSPSTQQVLLRPLSFNPFSDPSSVGDEELEACLDMALFESPWKYPEDLLSQDITSVLVSGTLGIVLEEAKDGNYFAIETGIFFPAQGSNCELAPDAYHGAQLGGYPSEQLSRFEHCPPSRFESINEQGVAIWAPIQNARITSSSSTTTIPISSGEPTATVGRAVTRSERSEEPPVYVEEYTVSTPSGSYTMPLSFPALEMLSVARFDPLFGNFFESAWRTASQHNYVMSVEMRYDSFNPRRASSGYFTYSTEHPMAGSHVNFSNYVVDATTLTVNAYLSKVPSSLGFVPVDVVGAAFGLSGGTTGFTEYDIEPIARGDVANDLNQPKNQGLLDEINVQDLLNTDTYIFRETSDAPLIGDNGEVLGNAPTLIGSRQGVSLTNVPAWDFSNGFQIEPGCQTHACLLFTVITRGAASSPFVRSGRRLDQNGWDYNRNGEITGGVNRAEALTSKSYERARVAQSVNFVRFGDQVRVVMINRSTGYMSDFRARVDVGQNGMPTYFQVSEDGSEPSIMASTILTPPNLKIRVRRLINVDKAQIVGADGAALTSDQALEITTEWYSEDGGPLPDTLPGFTGRLSRVINGDFVAGTGTEQSGEAVGQFTVKPGKHIVNIQLPDSSGELSKFHYYIHVSAAPTEELVKFAGGATGDEQPNFQANQVCHEYPESPTSTVWRCFVRPQRSDLTQRPALFVPFQVARFDATQTEALADQQAQQLLDAWKQGDPLPTLTDVEQIYRWIYSPEMHFSLYDLDVRDISLVTELDEHGDDTTDIAISYDLSEPDEEDLNRPGQQGEPDDGLTWGVGYEKIEAMVGEGSSAELADRATPADFVGLDLFVEGDEPNSLYGVDTLPILLADVRPLTFSKLSRTSFVAEGQTETATVQMQPEIIYTQVTQESFVKIYVQFEDGSGQILERDYDADLTGLKPIFAEGEYFIPLSAKRLCAIMNICDEVDYTKEFTIVLRGEKLTQPGQDSVPLTHDVKFPARYVAQREDWGEGLSVDTLGKLSTTSGTNGGFEDVPGGLSPEATSSRSETDTTMTSLVDGSLKMQRDDFNVSSIGPSLKFGRSYSNLESITSESTLGIGWRHPLDIQLIPVALEGETREEEPNWLTRLLGDESTPSSIRGGLATRAQLANAELPRRWGEVIVKGIRFKRDDGGVWLPERGFQGTLDEVGDTFEFVDLEGTVYQFPIPKVPMPDLEEPAEPTFESADMGSDSGIQDEPVVVRVEDRLIHRIKAETYVAPQDMGSDAGADLDQGLDMSDMDMGADPYPEGVVDPYAARLGRPQTVRVTRIRHVNGQSLDFTYDPNRPEELLQVVDGFGRRLEFDYVNAPLGGYSVPTQAERRMRRVRLMSASNVLEEALFDYNDAGYLIRARSQGRDERYEYQEDYPGALTQNLIETRTTPDGSTWQVTSYKYFDTASAQTFIVEGVPVRFWEVIERTTYPSQGDEPDAEVVYRYGRDATSGALARHVTDARGHETTYILNSYGNPVEVREPLGRTKRITWSIDRDAFVGASGNYMTSVATSYDSAGTIMRRIRYGQTRDVHGIITESWSCGPELISSSQAMSEDASSITCDRSDADEVTTFDSRFSSPTQHTDRNGRTEQWTYNDDGTVHTFTDTDGVQTTSTYYASGPLKGLKSQEVIQGRYTTEWTHDAFGYVSTAKVIVDIPGQGSRDEVYRSVHDERGWLTSSTTPTGETYQYVHDVTGRTTQVTYPTLASCPSGVNDNEFGIKCSGQGVVSSTYDKLGNLLTETDLNGLTLSYTYTARNQVATITRSSDNYLMRYLYDANGNLIQETDWVPSLAEADLSSNQVNYVYDELNRLVETRGRRALNGVTQTWDLAGRLIKSTDADGVQSFMEYDELDRLITECHGEPCDVDAGREGPKSIMTYYEGHDPLTNLKTRTVIRGDAQHPPATTSFVWDDGYRLVSQTDPKGRTQTWTYDVSGLLTASSDVWGVETQVSQDGLGRIWKLEKTGTSDGQPLQELVEYRYDEKGRLIELHGPYKKSDGNLFVTHQQFDAWDRAVKMWFDGVVDGQPRQIISESAYDARGDLVWKRAPDGGVTLSARDLLGRVTFSQDPEQGQITQVWNARSQIIEQVMSGDPTHGTPDTKICYDYNAPGDLVGRHEGVTVACAQAATDQAARHWEALEISPGGAFVRERDELGREIAREFDVVYRTRKTTVTGDNSEGVSTTLTPMEVRYLANGELREHTDILGNRTTYTYDPIDRTNSMQFFKRGAGSPYYEESWDHSVEQVTEHTDREGVVFVRTYDDFGNLERITVKAHPGLSADLTQWRGRYDSAGNLLRGHDARGFVTDYTYNERGLLETVTHPDVDGTRDTMSYTHDEMGRVDSMIDELGYQTDYTYDLMSRLLSQSYRGETRSQVYDVKGHLVESVPHRAQPGQRFAGQTTTYRYDALGRLIEVNEVGLVSRYEYNPIDQIKRAIGPSNQEMLWEYDGLSRLARRSLLQSCPASLAAQCVGEPAQFTTQWRGHDAAGNPSDMIDQLGQNFSYTYDELGRLTQTSIPARVNHPVTRPRPIELTTAYDVYDRPVQMTLEKVWPGNQPGDVAYTWEYDGRGRLDSETQLQTWSEAGQLRTRNLVRDFAWDDEDNLLCVATDSLTGCSAPGREATQYAYDGRNRLTSVTIPSGSSQYHYDALSRLQRIEHPNQVITQLAYHDQDADPVDNTTRLQSLVHGEQLTPLAAMSYVYEPGGQLKEETRDVTGEPLEVRTHTYDALDRLLQTQTQRASTTTRTQYTYSGYKRATEQHFDEVLLTKDLEYTYDQAERLRQIIDQVDQTQQRFEWDANGNLERWVMPGEEKVFEYNSLDQLVQVTRGPPDSMSIVAEHGYDALGMRIVEKFDDELTTRGWVQGRALQSWVQGHTPELTPQRTHHALGLLFARDTGSETGYYHTDHQGSILGLSTMQGGLIGKQRVDVFGLPLAQPLAPTATELAAQKHSYTGHLHDKASGLTYMKARYYAPELGMFLSRDPARGTLMDPRSRQPHLYAHANPVNNVDPDGRSTRFIGQHGTGFGGLTQTGSAFGRLDYGAFDLAGYQAIQGALIAQADASRFHDLDVYMQHTTQMVQAFAEAVGAGWAVAVMQHRAGMISTEQMMMQAAQSLMIRGGMGLALRGAMRGLRALRLLRSSLKRPPRGPGMLASRARGGARAGSQRISSKAGDRQNGMPASPTPKRDARRSLEHHDKKMPHATKRSGKQQQAEPERPGCQGGSCPLPGGGCKTKKRPGRNSFAGETPVLMCDGTLKPIGEMTEGEEVLAKDPETGELSCQTVLKVWSHTDDSLVEFELDSGEVFLATWAHPMMTPVGDELSAGLMQLGEPLGALHDSLHVVELRPVTVSTPVFNLTVSHAHTFFVGESALWVHNNDPTDDVPCPFDARIGFDEYHPYSGRRHFTYDYKEKGGKLVRKHLLYDERKNQGRKAKKVNQYGKPDSDDYPIGYVNRIELFAIKKNDKSRRFSEIEATTKKSHVSGKSTKDDKMREYDREQASCATIAGEFARQTCKDYDLYKEVSEKEAASGAIQHGDKYYNPLPDFFEGKSGRNRPYRGKTEEFWKSIDPTFGVPK